MIRGEEMPWEQRLMLRVEAESERDIVVVAVRGDYCLRGTERPDGQLGGFTVG